MKRILAMALSLLMIISIIPFGTMTANAASLDSRVEAAIQWAISIANDDSHGYSQSSRNGPNYDCSSFVSTAFKNGGFSVSGSLNTSSMANAFVNVGFTKYKKGDVTIQRGDILLKPGSHVELYLGDNTCVAAHSDYDGASGDGNGKEIQVRTKNYCTFCKQANYTYILRYNGSTTTSYTYSFNFNANGGSLGSTGAFTTSYGREFQILNTTCTRSGYTWAGWTVKRNTDNKWYVDGRGWCTESQISNNGYTKKVYSNYQTCKLDDSWINGISGNGSYTFYAVWIQNRNTQILIYTSPFGEGSDHLTALNNATNSGYTQERMYVWYILYDTNTGALMNSYTSRDYSVYVSIYDPNGDLVYDTTYDDSDANWISIVPQMSGQYVARAKYVCGSAEASVSTGYTVSYDTDLVSSLNSISLNLNGTNTRTPTITISGNHPGNYGVRYQFANSEIASAAWSGEWNGNSTTLSVTGKKYGSTNLTISVYENYSGNKNVIKQITIPVNVTANSYSINYNANGGSGAPSSQIKYYGTNITLSSTVPTRNGYTFLGWSTSSTATTATYQPGSTFSSNANTTLYAVWKANATTLSVNSTNSAYISTSGEMKYYTFTPSTSYTNVIYSTGSDDTMVYLYDASGNELAHNDDGGENHNFRLEYNFTAGTKYTFGVKYYNSSKTGTISFKFGNVYTISYNANGGTGAPSSQKKDYGANTTFSSTIPTRTGYTFKGWASFSSATSSAYQPGATYTSNIDTTLYAVWQANTYTISYNANGGSGSMSSSTHTYDASKSLSSNTFTRSGYTFLGWSTSSSATTATYTNGQSVKNLTSTNGATVNLYAVWSKIPTYTISYNANGGTGAPSSQTKTQDVNLTLSNTVPTRTGYTFKGWATSNTVTTATYQPGGTFTSNATITLYAVWQANTYTVRYNSNGGSGSMSNSTHTYDVSKSLSSNGFSRTGYTFLGWATSNSATSATYTDSQSVKNLTSTNGATVDLYAVWKTDTSALSANSTNSAVISSGGETKYYTFTPTTSGTYVIYSIGSEDTKVYLYNASGTELDSDDDDGDSNNFRLEYDLTAGITYTFGVRYYNASKTGTISFKFGNVYTVTYNANGGSGIPSAQSKDYGTSITLSSTTPTRTGYTFLGWSTSSTATSATYQPGGSFTTNTNTTLYAVWQANTTYTVSYNANGGSGAPSSQTKTYGVSLTLSNTTPTKSGHTFLGWSTNSTATSASYQPGDSFTTNANTTLYAVWKANTYTVSYNANGGSGAPSSQTKTYAVSLTLSSTVPTRTGYTFLGWSTSSTASSATYQPGGSFGIDTNTTLYAVWKQGCDNGTHTYNYTVTNAPTTSATGTLTGTCSKCSGTTIVTLPKLNTTDYSYSVRTAATCTVAGSGRYTWKTTTYGSFYFDVLISATGHNYSNGSCTRCSANDPNYDVSSAKYEVTNATGTAGSTIEVYVSIENNPGIISLRNTITYDSSALELISVQDCGLLAGYTTPSATISSPYTLRWADSLATQNNLSNGRVVKLTFQIKDDTEAGSYNISVTPVEARNVDGTKVAFSGASATVNVIDCIVGDTDGDGEVSDWDAIVLNRYLAGWSVGIELAAADVDGDGEVSDWDAIVLERYLAGWNVELES